MLELMIMQAGDRLDRIQGGERVHPSDDLLVVKQKFEELCDEVFLAHAPSARSFYDPEVIPGIESIELLLRVDDNDGSYLYIMLEASVRYDNKPAHLPYMSITEYTPGEQSLREHTYWLDDDVIRRSDNYELYGRLSHPSLVETLRALRDLQRMSPKEATQSSEDVWDDEPDEATQNAYKARELERALGFNDQPVTREEIDKLRQLLLVAQPWLPTA